MLREQIAQPNRQAILCVGNDGEFAENSSRISFKPSPANMEPRIQLRLFGVLPGGEKVEAFLLTGRGGLTLECLSYGGIVTRLLVPDTEGNLTDVVLGFENLSPYLSGMSCFGGIVGRVAGRIPGAQYRLQGATYSLAEKQVGFDKRLWRTSIVARPDGAPSLKLSLTSPHLDQGHPGNVEISVTYTLTDDNTFLIETEASTDRLTPFSLTHHTYFNLAGESSGTVEDHELQIHSDECIATDDRFTPLGFVEGLMSPGNDFRRMKSLGDNIPYLFRSHGDLYRLRMSSASAAQATVPAARLVHRASGRVLEVSTSSRCLQLSTASELDERNAGKSGTRYGKHAGIGLQCLGYPGGVSHPELGNIMLRPGQTRRETTAYVFSNIDA